MQKVVQGCSYQVRRQSYSVLLGYMPVVFAGDEACTACPGMFMFAACCF
ncbi:hypothetical protein MKD01_03575 [[Clostridium] innocuum]|nr:hypothetical protein [Erysipelotrichaceae bacterium]MCR0131390.1 hypothetical protein [[Clostridium] innocuum]MCR0284385.1 hypothetical protein [[Clostridium] innocuum]MCR0385939.1 hypothetical protein [[Clostridium] innocuum]MDU3790782.1 hypothetical protein [Erysipelotrichaceae bacterium]